MTSISSGSAALTILQQARNTTTAPKNAADAIIDIVSGRKANGTTQAGGITGATTKAPAAAVEAKPREAGGSISSAPTQAWMSAVSQINSMEAPVYRAPEASVRNAEALTGWLLKMVDMYNGQFDEPTQIPTREEWGEIVQSSEADRISRGQDVETAKAQSRILLSDRYYTNHASSIERTNQERLDNGEWAKRDRLPAAVARLNEAFGLDSLISYGGDGRAKVGNFDLYYANGQKMLSLGDDGSLTSFNADGSVRKALNNNQARSMSV